MLASTTRVQVLELVFHSVLRLRKKDKTEERRHSAVWCRLPTVFCASETHVCGRDKKMYGALTLGNHIHVQNYILAFAVVLASSVRRSRIFYTAQRNHLKMHRATCSGLFCSGYLLCRSSRNNLNGISNLQFVLIPRKLCSCAEALLR